MQYLLSSFWRQIDDIFFQPQSQVLNIIIYIINISQVIYLVRCKHSVTKNRFAKV